MEIQLAVKKGKTTTNALSVRHFPTLIGRHRECNLRIAARQVSRRHCVLKSRDGWLVVCDLDSCNGTLVNGRAIRGETVLKPGDQLEVGPVIFEIAYVAPNAEAKPHEAADTQILSATTKPEIDMVQVDRGDNAYELSERISELDRSKALDVLDTHRPGDEIGPSDSGSKIVILDESNGVNSPTARLFSSDFAKARSQDNR